MTKDPTRGFMLRLTEAERARVEAYRAASGLRSLTEAIRHLIETRGGTTTPYMADMRPFAPKPHGDAVALIHKDGNPTNNTPSNLTFGPIPSKPGDRLKKGK